MSRPETYKHFRSQCDADATHLTIPHTEGEGGGGEGERGVEGRGRGGWRGRGAEGRGARHLTIPHR